MAKAVTIYGIKNCDTMKKARAWLDKRGVTYEFHDYKSAGIERSMLEGWSRQAGWEALINRAGRTFRALPEKDQVGLTEKKAIALMAAQPSMIRRPVLDVGGQAGAVGEGIRPAALTSFSCAFRAPLSKASLGKTRASVPFAPVAVCAVIGRLTISGEMRMRYPFLLERLFRQVRIPRPARH